MMKMPKQEGRGDLKNYNSESKGEYMNFIRAIPMQRLNL